MLIRTAENNDDQVPTSPINAQLNQLERAFKVG
jgi:hypothetical protein